MKDECIDCLHGFDWLISDGNNMLNNEASFHWRGGSQRDTTGIHIWPEPFIVHDPVHGEVVVILMDTQGLWDNQTDNQGNSMIFCLSTLLTSLQVVLFVYPPPPWVPSNWGFINVTDFFVLLF